MNDSRKLLFLDFLDRETEMRWLEYWAAHGHASWRQHSACGNLQAAVGARVVYSVGFRDGKIALVGVFMYRPIGFGFGAPEAVCLRGPVFDDISFAEWCFPQIARHFHSLKVGTVRIGPYWRFPEAEEVERVLFASGYTPLEKPHPLGRRTTGIIDLRGSADEILKSFKQSTRRQINLAEKLGISFRTESSPSEAAKLFEHLDQRDLERGIERISPREYQEIVRTLAARNDLGIIVNAYHEENYLGGLLVVRGGKSASMSKFVVSETARHLFPTLRIAPAIFFRGMLWAKSLGCEFHDLEGYSTGDEGPSDQEFINRYKAGFNPVVCETLGQYYLVCHRARHRIQQVLSYGCGLARLPHRLIYKARFELRKRKSEGGEKQD